MGEVRKPTLDEWFLALQLNEVKKGFHLPMSIEADVTRLVSKFEGVGKMPTTAIMIKAASHLMQKMPEVNKVTFHTFLGLKIVEPRYNGVNLPLELFIDGKKILTGITIHDAYKKSLTDINSEIKLAKNKTLNDLPVNKIIHTPGIRLWKKMKLRLLHFCLSNFPSLYVKKRAGGISVSSLMNLALPNAVVNVNAYGMTTLTLCSCTLEDRGDKQVLRIGSSFDHSVVHGALGVKASIELAKILQSPELF